MSAHSGLLLDNLRSNPWRRCNRQIRTKDLLVKDEEVTRSTVQKAVVVLASKPLFGPIRDRLGVVTRALFAQRDFSDMSILDEFQTSLELSVRGQLTESGLYMGQCSFSEASILRRSLAKLPHTRFTGTSLRELVRTFRQRTLVLLKALMLQKKVRRLILRFNLSSDSDSCFTRPDYVLRSSG